jgi:hypothetical protein
MIKRHWSCVMNHCALLTFSNLKLFWFAMNEGLLLAGGACYQQRYLAGKRMNRANENKSWTDLNKSWLANLNMHEQDRIYKSFNNSVFILFPIYLIKNGTIKCLWYCIICLDHQSTIAKPTCLLSGSVSFIKQICTIWNLMSHSLVVYCAVIGLTLS